MKYAAVVLNFTQKLNNFRYEFKLVIYLLVSYYFSIIAILILGAKYAEEFFVIFINFVLMDHKEISRD